MEHGGHNFFVILDHFLHFYSPNNLKNQNFEKMKQPPGDIMTLHMCTINDNHMMYGSWDIEQNRRIFCHFGLFFAFWGELHQICTMPPPQQILCNSI